MAFGFVPAAGSSPVCLLGELDLSTSLALQDLDGSGPLILDVSVLTFIDSAGAHALEDLARRVGRLGLFSPPPTVLRVCDLALPEPPRRHVLRHPASSQASRR